MNYKTIEDMNDTIKKNLDTIHQLNVDLIVGIPRSGMIPAYIIALLLNKHCCTVEDYLNNQPFQHGRTREVDSLKSPKDANNILLVDDTVNNGKSIVEQMDRLVKEREEINIISLCIYSSTKINKFVDYYFECVPTPRFFEWNIFHQSITTDSCIDIDGVLCKDPSPNENDDGVKYREFLLNAKPLFLPSKKVKCLVTNRLEKYRDETEFWLSKHGIMYEQLIMLDLPSKKDRNEMDNVSKKKWEIYKQSNTSLFIESDDKQAQEIFQLTNKPVYCVDTNKLYTKNELTNILQGTRVSREKFILKIYNKLPRVIKRFIKLFKKK